MAKIIPSPFVRSPQVLSLLIGDGYTVTNKSDVSYFTQLKSGQYSSNTEVERE